MAQKAMTAEVLFLPKTGLTPAYEHTYRFNNRKEQRDFFDAKANKSILRYNQMSYQRVNANTIRVQIPPAELYVCDYCMINEHRHDMPGDDDQWWWYCFILAVNYINEGCTEVVYQVDVIQTWFCDVFLNMNTCFIKRWHASNDYPGANTQPENIDIGSEYVQNYVPWSNINRQFEEKSNGDYTGWYPVIAKPVITDQPSQTVSRIPGFVTYLSFSNSKLFNDYVYNMSGTEQAEIIDMFMYPENLIPGTDGKEKIITNTVAIPGRDGYNPWDSHWGSGTGYTPKNMKCYTYPYCFITITNNSGQSAIFKPEYFELEFTDGTPLHEAMFDITGTYGINPEFMCAPRLYDNVRARTPMNCVTLTGAPKIPWKSDAYKIYMSQNAASIKVSNVMSAKNAVTGAIDTIRGGASDVISQAIGLDKLDMIGGGAVTGKTKQRMSAMTDIANSGRGQMQAGVSSFESAISHMAKMRDLKNLPETINGAEAPGVMYLRGHFGFDCYITRLPVEYIRKVDLFWTMYGYNVGRPAKPNIFSRRHFNFLQCVNVSSRGAVPAADMASIQYILAKGITFWDRNTRIGDYSVDNSIV